MPRYHKKSTSVFEKQLLKSKLRSGWDPGREGGGGASDNAGETGDRVCEWDNRTSDSTKRSWTLRFDSC